MANQQQAVLAFDATPMNPQVLRRGVVNAAGRYIPDIPYERMERARVQRIPPDGVPQGVERTSIGILGLPEWMTPAQRTGLGLRLVLHSDLETAYSSERRAWAANGFECLFPGFSRTYLGNFIAIEPLAITEAQIRYWSTGELLNPSPADPAVPEWIAPTQATIASVNDMAADFQIQGLPYMDRGEIGEVTDYDLAAVLGMLLYAITKTPTDRNLSGFMVNRPAAAAASIGRVSMPAQLIPRRELYNFFSSLMVSTPALRIGLCKTFARWVASPHVSTLKGTVIAQVRIWRQHQLTSFKEVQAMMYRYGAVLRQIPFLTQDIENFYQHETSYVLIAEGETTAAGEVIQGDPLVDFRNAIYGNLSDLKSEPYPNLVFLMRDYKVLTAPSDDERTRWSNFAPNAPPNLTFEADIQRIANQLNISVPLRRATGAN